VFKSGENFNWRQQIATKQQTQQFSPFQKEIKPTTTTTKSTTMSRFNKPINNNNLTFMIIDAAVADENYRSTVRLFGVTADGHSVLCRVHGFKPYVYVQCPAAWANSDLEAKGRQLIEHIERHCADKVRHFEKGLAECRAVRDKRNIFGYCGDETERLLRLAFHSQWALRRFCEFLSGTSRFVQVYDEENNCFEQRVERDSDGERDARGFDGGKHQFWLCDESVKPLQQFFNESGVTPSRWVHVSNCVVPDNDDAELSRCRYEMSAQVADVVPINNREDIAPFKVESFDIECLRAAEDGQMPDASVAADAIIQIGSTVWRFGDEAYLCQVVHCVGETTLTDESIAVRCYRDEASMLRGYMRYMQEEIDPDIRLAYNSQGFDHHYLQQRLERHFPSANAVEREYGRIRGDVTEHCRSSYSGSRAHGNRTRYSVRTSGRVDIDMMLHAQHAWGIYRGGLNGLAESVLARKKDDVAPAEIRTHWLSGDAARRGVVARYCAVDTELPLEVAKKRLVLIEAVEMSRLCGIALDAVFNRGVSQRACAMLAREAHRGGYVQPEEPRRFVRDKQLLECLFDGGVQGALVLDPSPGLYRRPISTLDFASLYPSIMRAYGLCWTTLILDPQKWVVERRTPHIEQQVVAKSGATCTLYWARLPNDEKSLLYKILTTLLEARKAAKNAMAAAEAAQDTFLTNLYNAKQSAIKIVCNSMYGHCNCQFAPLFCPPIAAAVTNHGQRLLQEARAFVERDGRCKVIYGDTDSLMIDFNCGSGPEAFEHAFEQSQRFASAFSDTLPPEIKLVFEKVFYPFLMWDKKKRYCGMLFAKRGDEGVFASKGLEKRDALPLVLDIKQTVLQQILTFADHATILQCVTDSLEPLAVTLSKEARRARDLEYVDQLTVSKRLNKEPEMYDSKSDAHVCVALEIADRDPGRAPCAGDTVEFVWAVDEIEKHKGKVPVAVARFKSQPERFRLHMPHYVGLIRKPIESLLDLPDVASSATSDCGKVKRLFDSLECSCQCSAHWRPTDRTLLCQARFYQYRRYGSGNDVDRCETRHRSDREQRGTRVWLQSACARQNRLLPTSKRYRERCNCF
jgi:DNA polymerase delta subunit 1